jgi:hypothetical protein
VALILAKPNNIAYQQIAERLPSLSDIEGLSVPIGKESKLKLSAPLPVHRASYGDLMKVNGIFSVAQAGWTALIFQEKQSVASVSLEQLDDGQWRVLKVRVDPDVLAYQVRAIETASTLAEVGKWDFELRVLDLPALHAKAVWLASREARGTLEDSNIYVPFAGSLYKARLGERVGAVKFEELTRAAAEKQLALESKAAAARKPVTAR